MTRRGRAVIWFNRLVLAAVTFIMVTIAMRNLRDPVGATGPLDIELTSRSAMTIVRVGFGGFPLGFAIALFGCLIATRRLLTGMFLVLAIAGAVTLARVAGLLLGGAPTYNPRLLPAGPGGGGLGGAGILLVGRPRRRQAAGE